MATNYGNYFKPRLSKKEFLKLLFESGGNYAEAGRRLGRTRERLRQIANELSPEDIRDFNKERVMSASS